MKTKNLSGELNWIYGDALSETPQDCKFLLCLSEHGQLAIASWAEESLYRSAGEIQPPSLFYDAKTVLNRHSLYADIERSNIQGKLDFDGE